METLRALMNSNSSLKLLQDDSGKISMLRTTTKTIGGDTIHINDNIYSLTREIYNALSLTS